MKIVYQRPSRKARGRSVLTERYSVQKRAAAASGKRRHAKGSRPCTAVFPGVRGACKAWDRAMKNV